jgi:MtN3 and saliva related transmembrane protein
MEIETIGYLATICSITSLIPEIFKALKTHRLRDLSWGMICLMTLGSALWTMYGIAKESLPLQISAGVNLVFETILIYLKIHYSRHGHPILRRKAVETVAVSAKEDSSE